MNSYILNGWHYDMATAAVASLIDGYANLTNDEQAALIARYEAGIRFAGGLQMDQLLQAPPGTQLSDELVILGLEKDCTPACDVWTSPVALVLMRTDYEPVTESPLPRGNVMWVDPSTESTFLQTRADAELVKFRVG